MSFYFDSGDEGAGPSARGLNSYEFYGLGRGGTLGDVDVRRGARTRSRSSILGDRTAVDQGARARPIPSRPPRRTSRRPTPSPTRRSGQSTSRCWRVRARGAQGRGSVASGHHSLVDGYKKFAVPTDPVHAAYLGAILLRELRGCVHIDAVQRSRARRRSRRRTSRMRISSSCTATRRTRCPSRRPTRGEEDRGRGVHVSAMALYFDVLSDHEREVVPTARRDVRRYQRTLALRVSAWPRPTRLRIARDRALDLARDGGPAGDAGRSTWVRLPRHYVANHWDLAWVGLDAAQMHAVARGVGRVASSRTAGHLRERGGDALVGGRLVRRDDRSPR